MAICYQVWGESDRMLRHRTAEKLWQSCTGVCIWSWGWVKMNERFWVDLEDQDHQVTKLGLCFPDDSFLCSSGHKRTICVTFGSQERSISHTLFQCGSQSRAPVCTLLTHAVPDLRLLWLARGSGPAPRPQYQLEPSVLEPLSTTPGASAQPAAPAVIEPPLQHFILLGPCLLSSMT